MAKKKIKSKISKNKIFLEISEGDLYLKVPNDNLKIQKAISLLRCSLDYDNSEKEENSEKEIENPKEEVIINTPELPEINEFMEKCPKCNSKLKSKISKRNGEIVKIIKCKKNKWFRSKCDFVHEFSHKL